jgi:hypothetical protein
MGWDYGPKPASVKDYMNSLYTWETENKKCRVLKSAIVSMREYYAAVEVVEKKTGSREVVAAVALLNISRNELGKKTMDETCGPYSYNCPESILNLLTETDSEWAQEWRAKCRAQIAKRKMVSALKPGTVIRFNMPLSFSNGLEVDTFTVQDIKKGYFETAFGTVKIKQSTLVNCKWEIAEVKTPA